MKMYQKYKNGNNLFKGLAMGFTISLLLFSALFAFAMMAKVFSQEASELTKWAEVLGIFLAGGAVVGGELALTINIAESD